MMRIPAIFLLLLILASCEQGEQMVEPVVESPLSTKNAICLEEGNTVIPYNPSHRNRFQTTNITETMGCLRAEVKIKVWVIRKSDGTGGQPMELVNKGLQILSRDYAPLNISFINEGIEFIDNDEFYYPTENIYCGFCMSVGAALNGLVKGDLGIPYRSDDRIDIFLLPSVPGMNEDGYATTRRVEDENGDLVLPGNAMGIGGLNRGRENLLPTSVISHEMGHCLGLYHPDGTAFCGEPCSDLVDDTPPSPDLGADPASLVDSVTCEYIGEQLYDENGEPYEPLVSNVMVVSHVNCINGNFTPGQVNRINERMINSPVLDPIVNINSECRASNWSLAGVPDRLALSGKSFEVYLEEDGGACYVQPNPVSRIRFKVERSRVGITINGIPHQLTPGNTLELDIEGPSTCQIDPFMGLELKFSRLKIGNGIRTPIPEVSLELLSVSGLHTHTQKVHKFRVR